MVLKKEDVNTIEPGVDKSLFVKVSSSIFTSDEKLYVDLEGKITPQYFLNHPLVQLPPTTNMAIDVLRNANQIAKFRSAEVWVSNSAE